MSLTSRYGLSRIRAGDHLADSSYKYSDRDRELISLLLWLGAEGHRHTGVAASVGTIPGVPSLSSATTGGALPAGNRIYYRYTWVEDNGLESAPSDEVYVDMPAPVDEPGAAVLAAVAGGSLVPGNYFYALAAYKGASTSETKALSVVYMTIPATATNKSIRLTFPTPPAGATGWNIYRKSPGGGDFGFLASVPVATLLYTDTGAVALDCYRQLPRTNTTSAQNAVTFTVGAGQAGRSWKLYRTLVSGQYQNSLLHWVVEETSEGSGVIRTNYVDTGLATAAGQPPTSEQLAGSPSKVDLAGGLEAKNRLPMANVQAFPVVVTFAFVGTQMVVTGSNTWVCEYTRATIVGARAVLGRGKAPAAAALIVDVNKGSTIAPTMVTIYTDQTTRPRIAIGAQMGSRVAPGVTTLVAGDCLTVDVDQAGGGATPTDLDLTVNVTLLVQMDEATSTMVWS